MFFLTVCDLLHNKDITALSYSLQVFSQSIDEKKHIFKKLFVTMRFVVRFKMEQLAYTNVTMITSNPLLNHLIYLSLYAI